MKKLNWGASLFFIFIFTMAGCNADNESKQQVTNYGVINLAVNAQTDEGKIIEFLILNYRGPST